MSTSRVWRHRQLRAGEYEISSTLPDGSGLRQEALVSFPATMLRPSLTIRRIRDVMAQMNDGVVEDSPGVDWRQLGWDDQAEHDGLLADVHRIVESWAHLPHRDLLVGYVNAEKAAAGIPARPPFTVDQMSILDRLVRRAPAVIAQDLAAEGAAA